MNQPITLPAPTVEIPGIKNCFPDPAATALAAQVAKPTFVRNAGMRLWLFLQDL